MFVVIFVIICDVVYIDLLSYLSIFIARIVRITIQVILHVFKAMLILHDLRKLIISVDEN